MSSTYMQCPMEGVGVEHITQQQAQTLLDQAFEEWARDCEIHGRYNPATIHPITRRRYLPDFALPHRGLGECEFVNKGTDEPARPPYKGYGLTAEDYRQRYGDAWECRKHRVRPQLWFQYHAAAKRSREARKANRLKEVMLHPAGLTRMPHVAYYYSWNVVVWVTDRPMPKLMHAIFSEQFAPTQK